MSVWTPEQRTLLRLARDEIAECVALGSSASTREGRPSAYSPNLRHQPAWDYRFGATTITGNWSGNSAEIPYSRLDRWITGLPEWIRAAVREAWKRDDRATVEKLVVEAIDLDDPEPPLF